MNIVYHERANAVFLGGLNMFLCYCGDNAIRMYVEDSR